MTLSIVNFIKKVGNFQTGDYIAPLTRFMKYPLHITDLLVRVRKQATKYGIPVNLKTYRMNTQGIRLAKQEL